MPSATTPRPILWTIAAVIGSVLVGCAAKRGPDRPGRRAPPTDHERARASPEQADGDTKAPAFQASFAQDGGAPASGNDDATKDPTPAGGANQCIDNDDAGGSETAAEKLPDTDDCDTNYKDVSGVANGGVDQDWYTLAATDKGISLSHPLGCDINADFQDETAGTELCVYMRCKNSTADAVTGCDQGTPATSDDGMPGCCSAAPGRAVPTWNCSGLNDSMNFFIRVRQIDNGEQCLPYKLSYKF